MKTLTNLLLIASIISSNPIEAKSDVPSKLPFYILNAASEYNLDADLMYAICMQESNCKAKTVNRNDGTPDQKAAGIKVRSYGLFQLQVATAEGVGFVSKTKVTITRRRGKKLITKIKVVDNSKELLSPVTNTLYAAKLLRQLYKKYRTTEKVISAFNGGHPIQSNKDYVYKVLKNYAMLKIDRRR